MHKGLISFNIFLVVTCDSWDFLPEQKITSTRAVGLARLHGDEKHRKEEKTDHNR